MFKKVKDTIIAKVENNLEPSRIILIPFVGEQREFMNPQKEKQVIKIILMKRSSI